MTRSDIHVGGRTLPLHSVNTLIVGSGAAALNTAVNLHGMGQKDIAIVTESWGGGTSSEAGSDKQTYYKLSLSGETPDSPLEMAEDLYDGGSMHGDIALCEAANSLRAFFHLVELGVPFPHDRHGSYTGYRTDHDPRGRATSAGPLTSRLMFEALTTDVKAREIPVFDRHQVVGLLTARRDGEIHVIGALAINESETDSAHFGLVAFNAVNVVLGTGGPAAIYRDSVYPESQAGSHGLAFEIGATGVNLTESQFGLASISFRWNLSGTYQQVIPRYFSTDGNGNDERDFLNQFFPDMGTLASAIFRKGYQWPFDPGKVLGCGSSLIDILVYRETLHRGRRVFLDYTRNPYRGSLSEDFSFDQLDGEARDYLERSGALLDSPIERLKKMNMPAVDLYRRHGIDLETDPLEIAVCAQHQNGGLSGNIWWESNIRHLFPVGEVNGTHGVYRPGGSALNAGQVGSLRCATYITKRGGVPPPDPEEFFESAGDRIARMLEFARNIIVAGAKDDYFIRAAMREIRDRMSTHGAFIRDPGKIAGEVEKAWALFSRLRAEMKVPSAIYLPEAFRTLDLCLTHAMILEAIGEYVEKGGKSRGSYLIMDPKGTKPCRVLEDEWRFRLEGKDSFVDGNILEITFMDADSSVIKRWVKPRTIPREDGWFENVWKDFMNDDVVK